MTYCYWCLLLALWLLDFCLRWRRKRPDRRRRASCPPAEGFQPAPPRRSGGRPKPRWAIDLALRLFAETGSYRLATQAFNRLYAHTGVTVCLNTVYAWVQKYRSEMERVRRATRNRFPAPSPANLRWCVDGTGKRDAAGDDHFVLGVVDHGTRLNLVLKRLEHATAAAILREIGRAVERFGKPSVLRTDNASVFRSKVFADGLADLGIRHEFSAPGKPWQNGRVERFFLTLKQKLDRIVPACGSVLDRLLAEFSLWYNAVRPHQHLHGLTPAEAWSGVDPYRTAPKAVLRFTEWDGLLTGYYLRR